MSQKRYMSFICMRPELTYIYRAHSKDIYLFPRQGMDT